MLWIIAPVYACLLSVGYASLNKGTRNKTVIICFGLIAVLTPFTWVGTLAAFIALLWNVWSRLTRGKPAKEHALFVAYFVLTACVSVGLSVLYLIMKG